MGILPFIAYHFDLFLFPSVASSLTFTLFFFSFLRIFFYFICISFISVCVICLSFSFFIQYLAIVPVLSKCIRLSSINWTQKKPIDERKTAKEIMIKCVVLKRSSCVHVQHNKHFQWDISHAHCCRNGNETCEIKITVKPGIDAWHTHKRTQIHQRKRITLSTMLSSLIFFYSSLLCLSLSIHISFSLSSSYFPFLFVELTIHKNYTS